MPAPNRSAPSGGTAAKNLSFHVCSGDPHSRRTIARNLAHMTQARQLRLAWLEHDIAYEFCDRAAGCQRSPPRAAVGKTRISPALSCLGLGIRIPNLRQRLRFYTEKLLIVFHDGHHILTGLLREAWGAFIMKSIKRPGFLKGSGFSLAVKLYAIFALFALLTAAITALSEYNTRHGTELTRSIETANQAALGVERVNSLVYAIVMESR